MIPTSIYDDYFEWLYDLVCENRYGASVSYRKLFTALHNTIFWYDIQKDSNRAADGADLRARYGDENHILNAPELIEGPCSVLEMMIGLAVRCEETIMDDTAYGDRTAQWFWGMVNNLGLGGMTDDIFDKEYVEDVIHKLLIHDYAEDGRGGLFTVRDCPYDMRNLEIWNQLCFYLNTIS